MDRICEGPPAVSREDAWKLARATPEWFPGAPGPEAAFREASGRFAKYRAKGVIPPEDEREAGAKSTWGMKSAPVVDGEPNLARDVTWVLGNYERVVRYYGKGVNQTVRFYWRRIKSMPPSNAAVTWMKYAASNHATFMKDIVPKAMKEAQALDERIVEQEQKSISEMRDILRKLMKEWSSAGAA